MRRTRPGSGYRGGVQNQQTTTDRVDMAIGFAGGFVLNLGYLLLFHQDQRMLLMLFASVLVGMGMLLTASKGAVGMGVLFGAGASIAAALIMLGVHGSIVS